MTGTLLDGREIFLEIVIRFEKYAGVKQVAITAPRMELGTGNIAETLQKLGVFRTVGTRIFRVQTSQNPNTGAEAQMQPKDGPRAAFLFSRGSATRFDLPKVDCSLLALGPLSGWTTLWVSGRFFGVSVSGFRVEAAPMAGQSGSYTWSRALVAFPCFGLLVSLKTDT